MDEYWRNAFGILICTEKCDGAGAGICDGAPSTCSSSYIKPYFCNSKRTKKATKSNALIFWWPKNCGKETSATLLLPFQGSSSLRVCFIIMRDIAAVSLLSPLTGKVQGRSNTNQVLLIGILCFYHRSSVAFNKFLTLHFSISTQKIN